MQAVKSPIRAVAVLVFLFLVALTPLPVGAQASVDIINTRESSAIAEFQYTDGAITTFVSVTVSDSTFLQPQETLGPQPIPTLAVQIFRVDADGIPIVSAGIGTDQYEFAVAGDLSTAHVTANLQLFDDINAVFHDAVLDLSWAATGDLVTFHDGSHFVDPSLFVSVSNFRGQSREAVATGTLIYKGENFTPVPPIFALILDTQTEALGLVPDNPTP